MIPFLIYYSLLGIEMDLERRLEKRYNKLVRSHMSTSDLLSPGVKASLGSHKAFSETQGAWRFYNNERCRLNVLAQPMLNHAQTELEVSDETYGLVVHDWSGLIYKKHTSKQDRYGVHHEKELGYELQASLLISDKTGGPIAPLALNVMTQKEIHSTYCNELSRENTHLEELTKRIHYLEQSGFKKRLVHIIDREGDSVQLMRALPGILWLIRCRSNSHVTYQGASIRVDKLASQLSYTHSRSIVYKGQVAEQHLAEIEVLVTRVAKPKKSVNGKRHKIKGDSVSCRFIVSRVQDKHGNILAHWYLLSNLEGVCMGELALWYYWRWSIETFFKLLKSAGMQLESWQQETGEAIARRLLVACMACVLVWQIAEAKGPEANELREILIRLSRKQMKYGVTFTRPALFTGLCSLMNTLDLLENYDIKELTQMLRSVIGEAFV